jgi:hypothetical protein
LNADAALAAAIDRELRGTAGDERKAAESEKKQKPLSGFIRHGRSGKTAW